MRYPAAEKVEIIRLIEASHLPARRTLDKQHGWHWRLNAAMLMRTCMPDDYVKALYGFARKKGRASERDGVLT